MGVIWGRVVTVTSKPQRHPKTGVLRLRWAVPKDLQERVAVVLGKPGGRQLELIRSLGTKDCKAARAPMIEAERWANGILEAARKGAQPLTERHIQALAGLWYPRALAKWEADPAAAAAWDGYEEGYPGPAFDPRDPDPDPDAEPPPDWQRSYRKWVAGFEGEARDLLDQESTTTDQASVTRLAEVLSQRLAQARVVHARRRRGDYTPDPLLTTFPPLPDAQGPAKAPSDALTSGSSPAVSLTELWEAWRVVAAVKPRTVAETRYALGLLGKFLGHTDASKIAAADVRRWRDASKADGLTNNTWNNRLSLIGQVFDRAVKDERLAASPADKSLRLAKNKGAVRLPYTNAEAIQILLAARKETAPAKRWAHWIMAFTGMRVAEVLQLTRGDVQAEGPIWFLRVNEDDAGKSVKTGQRRNVPLHPAIIAEGFLAHVETVSSDGPLFPDKRLDRHGNRGGRGWNAVGKWVRDVAGIADPQKAPNHSWRHRVEDELRAAEVPEDARDALLGHARKTTGRVYGVRGEALSRLYAAVCKIPCPVVDRPASPPLFGSPEETSTGPCDGGPVGT